jgi:hypothetical protein
MPTLTRFFEDNYLPYAKTRKRGWGRDKTLFDNRLKAEFGELKLDEITRQHAQSYLTQLIEEEKLAPATANHHVKLLRQVLNVALDWDIISKNPVAKVRMLPVSNKVERLHERGAAGKAAGGPGDLPGKECLQRRPVPARDRGAPERGPHRHMGEHRSGASRVADPGRRLEVEEGPLGAA